MLLKSVARLKVEISKMSSRSRHSAVHQAASVNRVTRVGTYPSSLDLLLKNGCFGARMSRRDVGVG